MYKISPKTGQNSYLFPDTASVGVIEALFAIVAHHSVDSVVAYGAGFV
jgi:hypothetical protein